VLSHITIWRGVKRSVHIGAAIYQLGRTLEPAAEAGVNQWRIPETDVVVDVGPTSNEGVDGIPYPPTSALA
jgi:hypothetical protein